MVGSNTENDIFSLCLGGGDGDGIAAGDEFAIEFEGLTLTVS